MELGSSDLWDKSVLGVLTYYLISAKSIASMVSWGKPPMVSRIMPAAFIASDGPLGSDQNGHFCQGDTLIFHPRRPSPSVTPTQQKAEAGKAEPQEAPYFCHVSWNKLRHLTT